jgi:hypothetical protein
MRGSSWTDLLAEVVKRNQLQVELIPDEEKAETSCIAK